MEELYLIFAARYTCAPVSHERATGERSALHTYTGNHKYPDIQMGGAYFVEAGAFAVYLLALLWKRLSLSTVAVAGHIPSSSDITY